MTPFASQNIAPAPGIYPDVPAEIYHAWNAASNSRLIELDRSPAHMLEAIQNPPAPTPALVLGEAMHFCMLQPELFPSRFLLSGKCCVSTRGSDPCRNPGKVLFHGNWYCGVHRPKHAPANEQPILGETDYLKCRRMCGAVWHHPVARQIIERAEHRELSAVWKCADSGATCKLRADVLWPKSERLCADLKTTLDASPDGFMKSIFQQGYVFQAAHYTAGLNAIDWPVNDFIFIAVEKEPPFGVAVYRLRDDVLSAAHETVVRRLKIYQRCIETGEYPGYPQDIQEIGISDWSLGQMERANRMEVLA